MKQDLNDAYSRIGNVLYPVTQYCSRNFPEGHRLLRLLSNETFAGTFTFFAQVNFFCSRLAGG